MADEAGGTVVVQSYLRGEFKGWNGDTEFELDNGQVWKQVRYDYWYQYSYRPAVTIYEVGGRHELHVDGVGRVLEVRQVR